MRRRTKRIALAVLLVFGIPGAIIGALILTSSDVRRAPGWERVADMPEPRGEFAAAVGARLDTECEPLEPTCPGPLRIVVAGGLAGRGKAVASVHLYDPNTDRWTSGPSLPQTRHHLGAAGSGGVVYVSGGARRAREWRPERNLWALEPGAARWKALAPMPEARMAHQMVALGPKLYVVGGLGRSRDLLVYDTSAGKWSREPALPTARDHLGVAVRSGRIWAIGGRAGTSTDRVDIYDTRRKRWERGPTLPQPIGGMAAGNLPDGIHIIGGEDPELVGGGVLDLHYMLPAEGGRWRDAPLPAVATHGSASTVFSDRLFVVGGSRRHGGLSPLGWTGVAELYGKG